MSSSIPRDEYTERLNTRRRSRDDCTQRHLGLGYQRLIVVASAAVIAYAAFARGWLSGWWLLLPAAAFFWLGGRLQQLEMEREKRSRAMSFYERALARLEGRWAGHGETGERFLDGGHLYARDLDLFGDASLFQLMCQARTRMGEETLAGWLLQPGAPDVVAARQGAVQELAPSLDLREDLAVLGQDAATGVHADKLAAWGERPDLLGVHGFRPFARFLSVLGLLAVGVIVAYLAVIVAAFMGTNLDIATPVWAAMATYFVLTAIACGAVTVRFGSRSRAVLAEAEEAAHDVGLLAGVLERLEQERFSAPRLDALRKELDTQGWPPSRRIARLDRLIDLVQQRDNLYVRALGPLVLWDLHLGYALEDWRRASGAGVRRWLDAVGEIEALCSLAAYHYERPDDVFPDVEADEPFLAGEALGHPLLDVASAVTNDVSIGIDAKVLVISGSNMSGKSTLLRTVGVNAVLAQAGAPVRAARLRMSPLAVGASITVSDSLQDGESRFYAEILRLRAIVEQAEGGIPVLFLVDEVLQGTNSHDRRIGAEAIVAGLVDRGAIGFVTTHDLALTHIAESLGSKGGNVHFEDHLEGGKMTFDYRMRPGVVEKSNALELMRSVGFQV